MTKAKDVAENKYPTNLREDMRDSEIGRGNYLRNIMNRSKHEIFIDGWNAHAAIQDQEVEKLKQEIAELKCQLYETANYARNAKNNRP